jgi:crossover junction endodeoxyribonuclease RusA
MTVEIRFPIEFVVRGTPVSLQATRAKSREAWKRRVKAASYDALPEGHFSTEAPISVTLFYFPATDMQGDVDNIVKPILDALSKHIYNDDRQVERVWVQKFEPGRVFQFVRPSEVLSEALSGEKPLLFIRLGDDPAEGLA